MNTVDAKEIQSFSKDAAHWWDEGGAFAPLHRLNPVRLQYICNQILMHFSTAPLLYSPPQGGRSPFAGLSILDAGCGGGLVCEPMARLGARVTGIDADAKAIEVAKQHAAQAALNINYTCTAVEEVKEKHDVVLALEIIEHVADVESFVRHCVRLCKPGGIIVFSTLNRTAKSFALGIVAAEYILRWVPQGTHNWKKFIRPSELSRALRHAGARPVDVMGLAYNPIQQEFFLSRTDVAVNYFLSAIKN